MDKYEMTRLIQVKKQEDIVKEESIQRSRDKLRALVSKRIRTTMIGALAAVEENLKEYWTPEDGEDATPEQERLYSMFQQIRSVILDNGNNQIRLLEQDIDNFTVEARKYHMEFRLEK
jgi:hypothetical protein